MYCESTHVFKHQHSLPKRICLSEKPSIFLKSVIDAKVTGRLLIKNPLDSLVVWQVFLGNGKIHFANSLSGRKERLNYLLGIYFNDPYFKLKLPSDIHDDFIFIYQLWKCELVSFQQLRTLLAKSTQEAIVQILALPESECYFENELNLNHLILNLDLQKIFPNLSHKVKYWSSFQPHISSPFQRPFIVSERHKKDIYNHLFNGHCGDIQSILRKKIQEPDEILKAFENLLSFYEISCQLQVSTLNLILALQPLIISGKIELLPYQDLSIENHPSIALIDFSPGNQRLFKIIFERHGFKVINIEDPINSLLAIAKQKPKIVLINAKIQKIDPYQLCNLFRKATNLQNVPLMIVSEEDSVTGRIKAKLAGAVGFLTPPFHPHELIPIIMKKIQTTPSPESKLSKLYWQADQA